MVSALRIGAEAMISVLWSSIAGGVVASFLTGNPWVAGAITWSGGLFVLSLVAKWAFWLSICALICVGFAAPVLIVAWLLFIVFRNWVVALVPFVCNFKRCMSGMLAYPKIRRITLGWLTFRDDGEVVAFGERVPDGFERCEAWAWNAEQYFSSGGSGVDVRFAARVIAYARNKYGIMSLNDVTYNTVRKWLSHKMTSWGVRPTHIERQVDLMTCAVFMVANDQETVLEAVKLAKWFGHVYNSY